MVLQTVGATEATKTVLPTLESVWKKISLSERVGVNSVTLADLESIAQMPIFKKGPHKNGAFNLNSSKEFGHYHPAFLKWVEEQAIPSVAEGAFYEFTRKIYLDKVQYYAQLILEGRLILNEKPEVLVAAKKKYNQFLQDPLRPSLSAYKEFRLLEELSPEVLAFWVRRDLDGSAATIEQLLTRFIQIYDPNGYWLHRTRLRLNPRRERFKMAQIGSFHGDEVYIENGETVFAFYREKGMDVLKRDVAIIPQTTDAVIDRKDANTGKRVTLASTPATKPKSPFRDDDPFLILTGPLREGPLEKVAFDFKDCFGITTPVEGQENRTPPRKGCDVKLGKKTYHLSYTSYSEEILEPGAPGTFKFNLAIETGGVRQVINSVREIVWAGDLDRDGNLDLVVNAGFHYNIISSFELFLSSEAKDGDLLKSVTYFQSVGC